MAKIVLTGEKQVGKSTIIQRVLSGFDGTVGGFLTKREPAEGKTLIPIRLYDIRKMGNTEGWKIGVCSAVQMIEAYPECFDTHGVETLAFNAPPDLVVMDELGIMEKEAHGFQKRVLEIMESDLNILCVIKNKSNPFLDQVKEKADTIFYVNPQNRERIYTHVKQRICK